MVTRAEQMKRNYEDLVGAIVMQCVTDYRSAYRHLHDADESHRLDAQKKIVEVETFLTGDWLPALSDIDGGYLLQRMKEEVAA